MKTKKKKVTKSKTYKVVLEFDNHDAAHAFFANWLDGGGDGGGCSDWHTDEWDNKTHKWMRIKGTGAPYDENGKPQEDW
jgi:hypothetical protein